MSKEVIEVVCKGFKCHTCQWYHACFMASNGKMLLKGDRIKIEITREGK